MSIKNIVTGQLASITEYTAAGEVTDILTTGNITGSTLSAGTGNLQITGNTISSTASTITIDPLGDGGPLGSMIVSGNLQVTGTLTYNDVVNATTNDLQWIAANNAASESLATGAGLSVGPSGSYAQFTYNSVADSWQSSLPVIVDGNVTADYFIGDGSQLTGLPPTYANANVAAYLASNANVVITTTGNITSTGNIVAATIGNASTVLFGDGSNIAGLPAPYTDTDVSLYLASGIDTAGFETTGNVTANYFIGDGSLLTGITPLRAGFAKYTRTTDQTGVTNNTVVICNVLENISGSDIAVNTTTGSITLQPGKTYRLRGTVGYCNTINSTNSAISYQWWKPSTATWVGQGAGVVSPSSTAADAWQHGTAEYVVTVENSPLVLQLRVVGVSNSNAITPNTGSSFDTIWRIGAPFIDIEVLGGQAPYTDPIPPAFSATGSVSTVITATFTDTLVAYNNELLDSDGWFASNRYTPQRAGWYQISCGARLYVPASGQTNERGLLLRKNGADIGVSGGYGAVTGTISQLVYFNGTTDYVDVAITSSTTGTVPQSTNQTYFNGFWVRS